jgi:hypothetical protein
MRRFIDLTATERINPLRCPDYRLSAKSVVTAFKTSTRGEIAHLVIDSTGLKVFGEVSGKSKKYGQERRIWRKPHLRR